MFYSCFLVQFSFYFRLKTNKSHSNQIKCREIRHDSDFMFVLPIKRPNDDKIEILVMIKIKY